MDVSPQKEPSDKSPKKGPPDKAEADARQEKDTAPIQEDEGTPLSPVHQVDEQERLRYQEALDKYRSMRNQRRKLERELMYFELPGKELEVTTDKKAERERLLVMIKHKKVIDSRNASSKEDS